MPALVAEVVGCRPEYVNQVWRGSRRSEKKKGEAIEVATILLNECIETGIVKSENLYEDGITVHDIGGQWKQYVGKWFIEEVIRDGKLLYRKDDK